MHSRASQQKCRSQSRRTRAVPQQRPARPNAVAFTSYSDMLDSAMELFLTRNVAFKPEGPPSKKDIAHAGQVERAWHRALERSGDNPLCRRCLDAGLTPQEREVLVALLMVQLGMIGSSSRTVGETLTDLCLCGADHLAALHTLSDYGSLVRCGFVRCLNPDEDPGLQIMWVDPAIVDAVLHEGCPDEPGWPVRTEEEFKDRLEGLAQALSRKIAALKVCKEHTFGQEEAHRACRKVALEVARVHETLARHSEWKVARVLSQLGTPERIVLLALMGKDLGHIAPGNALLSGEGLGLAITDHPLEASAAVSKFVRVASSGLEQYIQPCGVCGGFSVKGMADVENTEFELAEQLRRDMLLARLELESARKALSQRIENVSGGGVSRVEVRKPNTELAQLVLSPRTREAIEMAIAQVHHADKLLADWGLGKVIPYGRGVTLLFSGPPGTGKTATAEALAHALKKQIVQADYAGVQSCYPGVTERGITAIFDSARRGQAVLFWDEVDAMLGTREMAHRHWEVRETNVLLQELERFEGVCILATNRKFALDAALERRITLKVEFEPPDRAMRREIWAKFLPQRLPLAADVSLDQLSELDLTGGEIKNVVLNAARLSLRRSAEGPVTLADFQRAMEMEREGRWNEEVGGRIGFTR